MSPKLQLALDMNNLETAISVADESANNVDIIEIGTVLAIECGLDSVRKIRKRLPNSKLLVDIRIIKAGGKLAEMAFSAGADIVTIISDATDETFKAVIDVKNKSENREILIEINDTYTDSDLKKWHDYGLNHLIFHRGSEITSSNEEWNDNDFNEIARLHKLGFKVYITGGIGLKEISLFKNVPVECFIIGRTIANADSPSKASLDFQNEIRKTFR